jgi:hypothetical protein
MGKTQKPGADSFSSANDGILPQGVFKEMKVFYLQQKGFPKQRYSDSLICSISYFGRPGRNSCNMHHALEPLCELGA